MVFSQVDLKVAPPGQPSFFIACIQLDLDLIMPGQSVVYMMISKVDHDHQPGQPGAGSARST